MYKIRKRKYSPANTNQSPSLQLSHKSATSLSALHKQALLSLFFFYYFQLTQRSMTLSSFLFFGSSKMKLEKKTGICHACWWSLETSEALEKKTLSQEEVSQFICPSQTGCHLPGPFPLPPPSPLSGPVVFRAGRVRWPQGSGAGSMEGCVRWESSDSPTRTSCHRWCVFLRALWRTECPRVFGCTGRAAETSPSGWEPGWEWGNFWPAWCQSTSWGFCTKMFTLV